MDWKEIKKQISKRDNYRCVVCANKAMGSQIHHLIHRKDGGNNDFSNLVNLCGKCHMLESDTPDFAIKRAYKLKISDIPKEREKVRSKLKQIELKLKNKANSKLQEYL